MMWKVKRTKLDRLFKDLDGKIATVRFRKRDGTMRTMNFRLGVGKGVTGTQRTPIDRYDTSYVTAFDMKANGFRTINLDTVEIVKANGQSYVVR